MLTKDLLKYRKINGYLKPGFINISDPDLLAIAEQLLSIYTPKNQFTRKDIDEHTLPILNVPKYQIVAKGLNKLILDRCDFSNTSECNLPELREKLFTLSAEMLKSTQISYEEYKRQILSSPTINKSDDVPFDTYSDLPDNETLIKIRKITAKELLERYNCSLVQSLLLHSGKLSAVVEENNPAKMRNLLKYLKFFRLLVLIRPAGKTKKKQFCKLTLEIDGPTNLFENTTKYGLQLASFFPAVCTLSKWKISSEIKLKDRVYKLILDEKSSIKSHYRNFNSYIPEEYKMFRKLFEQKINDWEIIESSPFIDMGQQELIFPDFSFQNTGGRVVHIEFFHRWHSTQLLKRLDYCECNPDIPLLVGVDRFLYNKPEIKNRLDASEWFNKNGILFRDFPGVERVHKRLKGITNNEQGISNVQIEKA